MAVFDWSGLKFVWRLHGYKDLGLGQLPSGSCVPLLLRMFGHALFLYHQLFCFFPLVNPHLGEFVFFSQHLFIRNKSASPMQGGVVCASFGLKLWTPDGKQNLAFWALQKPKAFDFRLHYYVPLQHLASTINLSSALSQNASLPPILTRFLS